ncbi:MAG: hypothetical protein K2M78_13555 [Lachnospiraceae bacterium]|nr:hypothetical protein [Lachnospiraceae bacterium]
MSIHLIVLQKDILLSLLNEDVRQHIGWYIQMILNEYLIEMYKALQNGYDLPDYISEEEYKYIQEHKNENKALTGFVGF